MIVTNKKVQVNSPEAIYRTIKGVMSSYDEFELDKEHFYTIGLNNRNVIQYVDLVSVGTINESIVHVRETFRYAILKGVSAIIVVHNHPSGELSPSKEDIQVSKRLTEAGKIIGIPLLDHIIVGDTGFNSLKENGFIE